MVVTISFLPLEAFLLLIVLNTGLCEEDIEPVEITRDPLPPETWDINDYENWELEGNKAQVEIKDDVTEDIWQMSQEEQDSVLYDLYEKQPERILEVDEDGLELSDSWIILDSDEDEEDGVNHSQNEFLHNEGISNEDEFHEDSDIRSEDFYLQPDNFDQEADSLQCEETITEKKTKRTKLSAKKRNKDEFYFKHKTYGKKHPRRGSTTVKIPNWKQNCCIRGKRVGNGRRTFLSQNIFQECKDRTRNLASRMSRSCKWIFWSCCEARALRRYYIHNQSSQKFC